MEWLAKFVLKSPFGSLALPTALSLVTFLGNLIIALSDDGVIDSQEFHQLMSGADGLQTALLVIIMAALRFKNSK